MEACVTPELSWTELQTLACNRGDYDYVRTFMHKIVNHWIGRLKPLAVIVVSFVSFVIAIVMLRILTTRLADSNYCVSER
jgi:hypothetical protein